MKQAIIWGRYSSEPQGDGTSRQRQTKLNRELAAREGITVIKEYFDEASSAKEGATPLFKKVVASLPPKVGIICENLDRISRGHPWRAKAYIADILEAGHFIYTSQDGRLYTEENLGDLETLVIGDLSANVAYAENSKRIKRVRESVVASIELVKQGKPAPLGNWLPAHLKFNKETRQYIIREEQKATYQYIFNEYANGKGCSAIAKELNDTKVPTLGTGKINGWYKSTVREILMYEGVTGVLNIKGERIENAFPPAISTALFEKVQKLLGVNKNRHGSFTSERVNNVFRGLTRCAHCGGAMRVSKQKDYIFCTGHWDDGNGCKVKNMVKFTPMEQEFLQWFVHHAKEALLGRDENLGRVESLTNEKVSVEAKIDALVSLLEDGMPKDRVKPRIAKLEAERQRISKELQAAKAETSNKAELPATFQQLEQLVDDALTNQEVRAKISKLVPNIVRQVNVDISDKMFPSFEVELVDGEKLKWEYDLEEAAYPIKGIDKKDNFILGKPKVSGSYKKGKEKEIKYAPDFWKKVEHSFKRR